MILRASTTVLGKLQKTLNQFWLVVLTILKKNVNGTDDIPYIMENNSHV